MTRTIADVVGQLVANPTNIPKLAAPPYSGYTSYSSKRGSKAALATASMQRHMSDEGWQLMLALEHAGYDLWGYDTPNPLTDVSKIIQQTDPQTVVLQDKREWDPHNNRLANLEEQFHNVEALAGRPDIFKLTVLKDCHQRPDYHRKSAEEIGCHAWIVYYHPKIVHHLAPYTRLEHLIRTYHSVNADLIPDYSSEDRVGCLLSGAVSSVYPLRQALLENLWRLPEVSYLPHPGYHKAGTCTPEYLRLLNLAKVAICTSSVYGYTLRKIIEATACGCIVITDLPTGDVLPRIDGNLIRVQGSTIDDQVDDIVNLLPLLYDAYDPELQAYWSSEALNYYDYRVLGSKLDYDIENLKTDYNVVF